VAACEELGVAEACRPVTQAEVGARCRSPLFRAGAFYPGAATVHPARLALGLRAKLVERGVSIFEGTLAEPPRPEGDGLLVATAGGRVRAGAVVLATGPALAGERPLRRRLTVTSSHIVITEPVPDVLEELGWTGGECITDSRTLLHWPAASTAAPSSTRTWWLRWSAI
jgi:glycine/D-amino acid oxidase-like deaminating enzyme